MPIERCARLAVLEALNVHKSFAITSFQLLKAPRGSGIPPIQSIGDDHRYTVAIFSFELRNRQTASSVNGLKCSRLVHRRYFLSTIVMKVLLPSARSRTCLNTCKSN